MTEIDILNRRLGDALGRVLGGSQPRFKWARAEDCFYYLRDHVGQDFKRYCWADRLGRVWLLTHWDVPKLFDPATNTTRDLTEQDWWVSFQGTMPFPKNGEYQAHAETALLPGCVPTAELTANYIWALDKQMSTSYMRQLIQHSTELAIDRRNREDKFYQDALDMVPAFNNWTPGVRGYSTSFGGV